MKVAIIGLPNVGKSTLFNALAAAEVPAENRPFCTIEPNRALVPIPDPRLDAVAEAAGMQRKVYATLELVDVAGLVKGASRGEGLGNRFLAQVREADAAVHVLRCFESARVTHVAGAVDPADDAEVVNTELALADLATVERALDSTRRRARSGRPEQKQEVAQLEALHDYLSGNPGAPPAPSSSAAPLASAGPPPHSQTAAPPANPGASLPPTQSARRPPGTATSGAATHAHAPPLLTRMPTLYALNVAEEHLESGGPTGPAATAEQYAAARQAPSVRVSARLESELAAMPKHEQQELRDGLALPAHALHRFMQALRSLLNLNTFFTAGPSEARAWLLPGGATAWHAAGRVHSDFQQRFVRAEVTPWRQFASRPQPLPALKGRDYIVRDGEVLRFRAS